MTEILKLNERINIAIEVGESHFREFKSALEGSPESKKNRDVKDISSDISKTLVAFANADGGELLIGVEDNGTISGCHHSDELLDYIKNSYKEFVHKDTPLQSVKSHILKIENLKIVYFSIPKSDKYIHITSDGRCLQRRDLESVPISPHSISQERNEQLSKRYDRQFVDEATFQDFDSNLLEKVSKQFSQTISSEKYLQHLDLAEFTGDKLIFRKAALLLFAKDINRWHPRCQIRVLKIKGTEVKTGKEYNVIQDNVLSKNIIELIEEGWDIIRPYLTETRFSEDAVFNTQIIYPELACKEALINAIAHRDYSNEGAGIEIYIFDDRIVFKSPGELLSSIKLDDIKKRNGTHQSRNSNVAKVLKDLGFMRELGEGFRRIYELMEKNDFTEPEINSHNGYFHLTLSQKLVYSEKEKIWLEEFNSLNLSREQRTVVRLGANGDLISPQDIWNSVGIVDTEDYRKLLESLKSLDILTSAIPKFEAINFARKNNIDRKKVRRFRIKPPKRETKIIHENTSEKTDDSDYEKIYIGNLNYFSTEEKIRDYFCKYGEVSNVDLPINRYEPTKNRGFGFVEFEDKSVVNNVFEDKLNIEIDDRKIFIRKYIPQKGKTRNFI